MQLLCHELRLLVADNVYVKRYIRKKSFTYADNYSDSGLKKDTRVSIPA